MGRRLGGIGTLLFLGLGLGFLQSRIPAGTNSASAKVVSKSGTFDVTRGSATTNNANLLCPEKDLIDTIHAFAAHPDEQTCGWDQLIKAIVDLSYNESADVKFGIAIVPDPIHTHLSLFFDRAIDSIEQGAQQAGWLFDHATMPWDSERHPESTDFHLRLQQADYQQAKENLPGLMIFRRDPKNAMFLFVVAETPTGGVNKEQFREAIQLIPRSAREGTSLRIIGPTFSGSLDSLAKLLNYDYSPAFLKKTVIRSGTVSSWDTIARFHDCWLDNRPDIDFATFQQSDQYMLREFVQFVTLRRGYSPERIAVLTEDDTAYGNVAQVASNCSVKQIEDDPSVLRLYFPRDISQLRSAYQQGIDQKTLVSTDSYQVHTTLPLNFQDTGHDDDAVQQYAQTETPLSQEAILIGIVSAIREHHIEYVVLQATNPMDTLFLSTFLRKGYSQARIVTMPADLLLSRDTDDISLLHGTMALSTYSLLPGLNEKVARPIPLHETTQAEHVFPGAFSAGIFNATLSQATCMANATAIGCDVTDPPTNLPVARYTEYGWPALSRPSPLTPLQPVVWLTVLGRNGFWPVAILDDGSQTAVGDLRSNLRPIASLGCPNSQESKYHPDCCVYREPRFNPPLPLFWKIVCGLTVAIAIIFCVMLRRSSIMHNSSTMTLLAPVRDQKRAWLIAAIGLLILSAFLVLLWPWMAWWKAGLCPSIQVVLSGLVAFAFMLACSHELKRRSAPIACIAFMISATLSTTFVFLLLHVGDWHTLNPFLYRYIHMTSGVSPALPFLCLVAGGLWWAWFSVYGLVFVDKRRPRLPAADDLLPPFTPPTRLSETFSAELIAITQPARWNQWVYGPSLLPLVIVLFSWNYQHPVFSLEARHFDWIFVSCLLIGTLVLVSSIFRLLIIWQRLSQLLAALDRLPLRRAFAELRFAWKPIWRMGGGRWQDLYRLVSRQNETLEHLRDALSKEHDDLERNDFLNSKAVDPNLEVLRRSIDSAMNKSRDLRAAAKSVLKDPNDPNVREPLRSDFPIEEYRSFQEQLASTCAVALSYLYSKWRTDEGLILCEVDSVDDPKETINDGSDDPRTLSTQLAERFVALIYLNFILSVLLRMRTLTTAAVGVFVFLLLSVNVYPFEPKESLQAIAVLVLGLMVGIVGYVFAQIHRESILSLVTRTKPGELGAEFWVRIGAFAALPLLSLLVSQFPALNNALFSWLEPAVNALK